MNPNCCKRSQEMRSVSLFVPMGDGSWSKVHWAVPLRDEDGEVSKNGVTQAYFCPFCGLKLGREHVPFDGDAPPTPNEVGQ